MITFPRRRHTLVDTRITILPCVQPIMWKHDELEGLHRGEPRRIPHATFAATVARHRSASSRTIEPSRALMKESAAV